ncbi:uncharacterized protein ColSpa_09852 [Colletotrichum spaethianum]|uniref:Uncharacterized protein n=1 Tax=Colletotrichum spaethianum TaxID=700344 RepID=A0AA37PCC4_9PEZI|nr:uncharacterized protein ColSpa_09852 [Colletotrichum spaethianum]GKT49671.1 hypothetical protein ColSpa_09852 [Colletotrichum spaethianum]
MEEHIKTLIDELEGDEDVMAMFLIPRGTRDQIIKKLKRWLRPLGDNYTPKKLRPAVIDNFLRSEQHGQSLFGEARWPEVNDSTKEFRELGVLFAEDVFIDRREPALRPLLDAFRSDAEGSKQALEEYIDANWRTNPTILDMDYESRRYEGLEPGATIAKLAQSIVLDPAQLMRSLYNPAKGQETDGQVLKTLSSLFEIMSTATMTLIKRVEIEAIAGEMADILERIRYDKLTHRSQKPLKVGAIDATQFPRHYDRIHMSNVP